MLQECRQLPGLLLLLVIRVHSLLNDTAYKCDGLVFNNVYYDKQMLFNQFGETYNLLMHPSGNLFFSHIIDNTNKTYGITVCHMNTLTCRQVKGIPEGYAIAYDQGNNKIYFGGKGIYEYNFQKQYATYFAEKYRTVSDISIGRNFYFVEYPSKKLYLYRKGQFVKTNKTENMEIEKFFLSNTLKIYFTNRTGLFKVEKPYKNPRTYLLSNKLSIKQITQDVLSRTYFCTTDGIYIEDGSKHKLKKIANIDHATGLTFQTFPKSEVIFSDKNAIYKLLPSTKAWLCFNRKNMDYISIKENISSTNAKYKEKEMHQVTTPIQTVSTPLPAESHRITTPIPTEETNPPQIQRRFVKPEFIFRGKIMHF